jgi:asparagine synthase (glutamine-hydrolysing)
MCGIAGFINERTDPGDFSVVVNRMLSAIRYRGPDEIGCRVDNNAALGAVRLSIIDIVSGQQPMASRDDRYWLCFNGEIFNYIELRQELKERGHCFLTTSDTEVLLLALIEWGEAALGRLDGQFSFAFYDRVCRSLLIGRDRFGERPLFYAQKDGALIFSSELKSLMQHPQVNRELSVSSIGNVFRLWTAAPGRTCFVGVHRLPQGHLLRYESGAIEVKAYYGLPLPTCPSAMSFDDAVEEVRLRLKDSVRLRLRSDVPIGIYLSGGLDSSIVTGLVREQIGGRLDSYSIAFEDQEYDESIFQAEAAARYSTQHHAIRVTHRDIVEVFPQVVRHAEMPLFRSAPAPMFLLAGAVASNGLKVVLSGEGADEAFLGYDIFKETVFRARFDAFADDDERRRAVDGLYPYMAGLNHGGRESLLRALAARTGNSDAPLFSHQIRFALGQFAERLLLEPGQDAEAALLADILARYPGFVSVSPLARAQIVEYETLLEGYLLCSQGDRMTTAHGVEARCPFLDPELVKLAFSLPDEFKLRNGVDEKFILKEAFRDLLPPSIYSRPKQPYRAPDCRAFLQFADDGWIAHSLSQASLRASNIFKPEIVERFVGRLKTLPPSAIAPREDQAFMLLLSCQLLHSQFIDDFPASEPTDFGTFAVFEDRRG